MNDNETPGNNPEKAVAEEREQTANDIDPDSANSGLSELDWGEASSKWEAQRNSRKEISLPVRDENGNVSGKVTFEYRMLTEDERRDAENAATSIEVKRNKEEVTTDSGALKRTLIKHGVTDGPEGFRTEERFIRSMPDHIKEPLASAIDEFSEMPMEVEEGF